MNELETAVDANFDLVGGQLTDLEERLEATEWQATSNEGRLDDYEIQINDLESLVAKDETKLDKFALFSHRQRGALRCFRKSDD